MLQYRFCSLLHSWHLMTEQHRLIRLKASETKDERKTLMESCRKVVGSLDIKKRLAAVNPRELFDMHMLLCYSYSDCCFNIVFLHMCLSFTILEYDYCNANNMFLDCTLSLPLSIATLLQKCGKDHFLCVRWNHRYVYKCSFMCNNELRFKWLSFLEGSLPDIQQGVPEV